MSGYTLAYGTHASAQDGRCAMEWVSYLAGEPHSDQPACVSPVLRAMCIALNDGLDQEPRQRLRPYLTRTIGTADDGLDATRGWMAMDWLTRVYTPAWLRLAGLADSAERLEGAAEVADTGSLRQALDRLEDARREAAWACAGAAAWAAARIGIGDIVGDRARAAARAAAGDAAAIAVRHSREAARRTWARSAAQAALEPTLEMLADSALALLDRMLPTEQLPLPEPVVLAGQTVTPA
ncbi:MAG: hypothetical protein ACXVRW_11045 [Solirubrobacteraceae bacterium]